MGHLTMVVLAVVFAGATPGEGTRIPPNLKGGPFQSTLEDMWRVSPTFRVQCARIAAEPALTVRLRAEVRPGSPRARTEFSRRGGALILADVVISDARDRFELIGHEIEHVLEQLEGVRLRERRCGAARFVTSVYESCRAIDAGRRVAREMEETVR